MGACCASCARGGGCEGSACGIGKPSGDSPMKALGKVSPLGLSSRQGGIGAAIGPALSAAVGPRGFDQEKHRASGDPPNPWAAFGAGSALGPADAPGSPGTFGAPGYGTPGASPGGGGPGAGEVLGNVAAAGLGALGGYLRGEQATQIAQTQEQGRLNAANIAAQAQRDVAQIQAEARRQEAIAAQMQAQAQGQAAQAAAMQAQVQAQAQASGLVPPGYTQTSQNRPVTTPPEAGMSDGMKLALGVLGGFGLLGIVAYVVKEATKPPPPPPPRPYIDGMERP